MLSRLLTLFQEKVENRYYGKYRGVVENNEDPDKRGRLMVKVPALMGEKVIGWAMPCFPYGGGSNRGFYMIPENKDGVWVEFEEGNLSYPIWSGTWWAKDETPKGVDDADPTPDLKIIKSRKGHIIQLDDTDGSENITIKEATNGHVVTMNQDGIKIIDGANSNEVILDSTGITISDKVNSPGNEVKMDSQGITCKDKNNNTVSMNGDGIKIKDKNDNTISMNATGGYPSGKGIELNGSSRICLEGLIDWLLSHKHIGNFGAPTPLFPDDMVTLMTKRSLPQAGILSDTVKVK